MQYYTISVEKDKEWLIMIWLPGLDTADKEHHQVADPKLPVGEAQR